MQVVQEKLSDNAVSAPFLNQVVSPHSSLWQPAFPSTFKYELFGTAMKSLHFFKAYSSTFSYIWPVFRRLSQRFEVEVYVFPSLTFAYQKRW